MMKKALCIILSLCTLLALAGCSGNDNTNPPPKAFAKIENDLDVEVTNGNFNECIYLTKDKFFFNSQTYRNSFGDGLEAFVYDLKKQEISPMFDFESSGIEKVAMATKDKLYINTYTYTKYKLSEWGYCLVEYDIASGNTKKIYETPNTVYDISTNVINGTLFYAASTSDQNGADADISKYEIHTLKDGKDAVILDGIASDWVEFFELDGKNYFGYNDCGDWSKPVIYEIADTCAIKKTDKKVNLEEVTAGELKEDTAGGLPVDGKFGNYYILDDGEVDKFHVFDNGYNYHSNFYLYNVKTKEKAKLTTAIYTDYYA